MKRYDLMQDINTRGTFLVSKACLPHLLEAENPHVLTLSPPLNLNPRWFGQHVAYTIAKYGMSMVALGIAEEFRDRGVASNALWPRTIIATAAVQNLLGGDAAMARSRRPEIMADAAHAILTPPGARGDRQLLHRRRGARRGGRHRPLGVRLRRRGGDDLQLDIFLDA